MQRVNDNFAEHKLKPTNEMVYKFMIYFYLLTISNLFDLFHNYKKLQKRNCILPEMHKLYIIYSNQMLGLKTYKEKLIKIRRQMLDIHQRSRSLKVYLFATYNILNVFFPKSKCCELYPLEACTIHKRFQDERVGGKNPKTSPRRGANR